MVLVKSSVDIAICTAGDMSVYAVRLTLAGTKEPEMALLQSSLDIAIWTYKNMMQMTVACSVAFGHAV